MRLTRSNALHSYTTHKLGPLPMPEQHSDTILTQLADLESRLAFQDDTIETLNQLVTQQSEQLQRMEQRLKFLAQRLQQLQERSDDQESNDPADEVPPHY